MAVLTLVNTFEAKAKRTTKLREAKAKMTNLAHEMDSEINAKELAKREGIGVRAIGIPYTKLRAAGHPLFALKFDCNAPLSPEQIAVLRPGKMTAQKSPTKKANSVATFATGVSMRAEQGRSNEAVPQGDEAGDKWTWQMWVFVVGAFLLVIGHAGLIWFDMATLWAMPGKIGGGVVFSFILIGMVLMSEKSPGMVDIREHMLWAVGLLEALAVVVHRAAFYRNASEAYLAGLGNEYIWALAAVICLCSIGATVFYQKVIRL